MIIFIDQNGYVRSRIVNNPQGSDPTINQGIEIDPDSIPPRPETKRGETVLLHYDEGTGVLTYHVVERPLTIDEKSEILEKAIQITTREMIRQDQLTQEELEELVHIYPPWSGDGVNYKIGDIVKYEKALFEVIQAHTSQSDWDPIVATSLFKNKMPEGIIPEWQQPTGAHDAYNIGDRVTFEGSVYESLIDGNTWSPTEYPTGWKLID